VVVYFAQRWCIILDSCSLCFGVDLAFQKKMKDDFVSIFSWMQHGMLKYDFSLES
jgi:hypothetical protein